ncbi:MAG: endonuclease V [Methanothrix sp.]|nr:endonuclease V [Methanothrix sp.]
MNSLDPDLEKRLVEMQRRIASRVVLQDQFSEEAVAGVDQAFSGELVISGAVVLSPSFRVLCTASHIMRAALPYVPGFLCFREGAPATKAVRDLDPKPMLLFVDGCGVNHPRMAGLACYVGIILGVPTIGISKDVLCGSFKKPENVGEAEPLIYREKTVGYGLLSRKGCRPIVVAPGHRISVDSALEVTRRYLKGQKLPEPCRLAHEYANKIKISRSPEPEASP